MADDSQEHLVEALVVHRTIETMDFARLEELLLDPEAREAMKEEDEEVRAHGWGGMEGQKGSKHPRA